MEDFDQFDGARGDDHAFVVLAYRESPFLVGCLESLRAQTRPSRIVVSTSTPCDYIARAAAQAGAVLVVNPERRDIAADWNFGLSAALDARFVTLAHQDDVYAPDFLAETMVAFSRADGVLCFTGYEEIDDAGAPKSSKISKVKHLIERVTLGSGGAARGARLRAFLSFGNPLPCSSVTFDLAKLPDFQFSDAFESNLDWDAWQRLMARGEVFVRTTRRLVGRRHNQQTTTAGHLKDGTRRREDRIMFRRLWPRPLSDAIAYVYCMGY